MLIGGRAEAAASISAAPRIARAGKDLQGAASIIDLVTERTKPTDANMSGKSILLAWKPRMESFRG